MARPSFPKPNLADPAAVDEFIAAQSHQVGTPAKAPQSPVVVTETAEAVQVSPEAPEAPDAPSVDAVAVPAVSMASEKATDKIAELQRQLAEAQKLIREEQVRKARFPWENPDKLEEQGRTGYNFKLEPELYLKIQWLMENRGGFKSIQVFLDKAGQHYADKLLAELMAK